MPVPSIRSLWRRFGSNVRERAGRNGERIGATRALHPAPRAHPTVLARSLLPACGEKVGTRGRCRRAQTRGHAPHPDCGACHRTGHCGPDPLAIRPLPASGERKASHPRLKNCTARPFFCAAARVANVSRLRRPSASLDKIHNALDVFEDLLFRFIAFGGLCRQPSAAGRKQVFKGIADRRIGIKVSGDHTKSSAITIRGRLIVAANGVAHAHEQGL
jgi:hypothetical protein